MTARFLVSHPHGAAVSAATAAALERDGALSLYVTGVGAAERSLRARAMRRLASRWPVLSNRLIEGVDPSRVRSLAAVELAARATALSARAVGLGGPSTYDAVFVAHDAVAARIPWPRLTEAVYAYEDGALETFRRAARAGLRKVLDQPLPWWRSIAEMWRTESARWPGAMGEAPPSEPEWKRRRKDAELALADAVSVASAFTRRSLEEAGCRVPIIAVPYGFPIGRFRPRSAPPSGPFTVLSVGSQDLRKGTPYLLEAWRRAGLKDARLRLVGRMGLDRRFLSPYAGSYEHVPWMAKGVLEAEYQAADLLAFPTLGDGFGLVIQEAMCCGTPVATTRCGGGPECILDGEEGLLFQEASVDALVELLRWAAGNRDRLHAMGRAARRRAEGWTWGAAGRALVDALSRRQT